MEISENQKKVAMLNAQKAGHGKSKGKAGGASPPFCTWESSAQSLFAALSGEEKPGLLEEQTQTDKQVWRVFFRFGFGCIKYLR